MNIFLLFLLCFILLTPWKAQRRYIQCKQLTQRVSGDARYGFPIEILSALELLAKTAKQEKVGKVFFSRTQQNGGVGFDRVDHNQDALLAT